MTNDNELEIGDRVRLANEDARESYHAMNHGVVVYYRGAHDPAHPRVRWASGWGTTVTISKMPLRLMTEDEKNANPPPDVIPADTTAADTGECTFKAGGKPCPTCPRLITALHRCGLLQEEAKLLRYEEPLQLRTHQL